MTKYTFQPNPTDSDYYDQVIKSYSQILPYKHLINTTWVATIHGDLMDKELLDKIKQDGEVNVVWSICDE